MSKKAFAFFKWKWHNIQPSMVTHTRNSCSAFTHPSTHTEQWTDTHREHTPRAVGSHLCCGAREQLGVWGPAQEHLVVVLKVERELYIYSPPPIIPAGPRLELATFRLWVRFSTIRPRLPQVVKWSSMKFMIIKDLLVLQLVYEKVLSVQHISASTARLVRSD